MLLPLVLLAGCTEAATPGATPSPQVSLPPENPAPGDHETAFIDSKGTVRDYIVHAPPGYTTGKSYPMVLVFHGRPGEAKGMPKLTKMNEVADANDFLAVYPDQFTDTEAVGELIDHLTAKWGVDPKRVHATGFSRGAQFTYELAAELTGRFGSVAPVSGIGASEAPLPQPISLITFQGALDRLRQGFTTTNNNWRGAAGCAEKSVTTITMEGGPTHIYTAACKGNAEHIVYAIARMAHEWPADASKLIWQFFANHPLP